MGRLTGLGLSRPRLVLFFMLALVVIGSLLYGDFPKREEPAITIRTAVVTAAFPGMTPSRMERLVTEPIERSIRQVPEVEDIDTLLVAARLRIHVTLYDRFTDLDPIWQELRDRMETVARSLPDGTRGPFVDTDFGEVAIASIALTGEGFEPAEMEDTARELQRRLYALPGVSRVRFHGAREERIWLEFDAARLAAVGVQLPVLIEELRDQNIVLPAGELNAGGTRFLLETSGDFTDLTEVRQMLSAIGSGDQFVRLGDLVSVRRGYAEPPGSLALMNGREALVLAVEMQEGFDILDVGAAIRAEVRAFEQLLPIGYALEFATFQPAEVERAVRNALGNVAGTFLAVLLVVMAFLGLRTGLVIASIVPFAVLFALIGMDLLDIALHQVSIAAVIISLGLLVDNGVVMVEDIARRRQEGLDGHAAALAAGRQFALPLAIASGTTILAFLPFFLLSGPEGEYAFSLAAVVTLTLAGSWFSAMFLLPVIAARWVRPRRVATHAVGDLYQRLLTRLLPRAGLVLTVILVLITAGTLLLVRMPSELFPPSDRDEVLIYMDMPRSTHISETTRVAREVQAWLGDSQVNPEVRSRLVYVGEGGPRFYLTLDPADAAPSSAFILVGTTGLEASLAVVDRARRHFIEQFPEARFRVKRLSMGAREGGVVDVEITGRDGDRLLELARQVETAFHGQPGLVENQDDWGEKIVKVVVDVDQHRARRLGISSASLSRVLSAYLDGHPVSDFRAGDETVPILLRARESDRDSVADLTNLSVLDDAGEVVPLDQVAVIRPALDFSRLRRHDQQRMITVTAKSDRLTADALVDRVRDQLRDPIGKIDADSDASLAIAGEIEDRREIYGRIGAGLPAALTLMLLLVILQFDSFRRALILFASVPLILIGAPLGLLLGGHPMSFMGTLGLISLAGIIINNGIVLIDQIDLERNRIEDRSRAIITAAGRRAGPILLTSVTTVVGLVPLYLFGGPLWEPLAAVIIGGLSVASATSLLFIPAAYALLMPPLRPHPGAPEADPEASAA